MEKKRSNIVNFLLMMVHWLMADAAVTLGFLVQLAFPKDPHPEVMASLFSNKIYHINVPLYILGTIALVAGYFFIWKLWLKEDWINFRGEKKVWRVLEVILFIINLLILFILFYLVMFLFVQWGFYGDGSRWVDYSIFGVWVVLIAIPVFLLHKEK